MVSGDLVSKRIIGKNWFIFKWWIGSIIRYRKCVCLFLWCRNGWKCYKRIICRVKSVRWVRSYYDFCVRICRNWFRYCLYELFEKIS